MTCHTTPEERFFNKILKSSKGCWEWQAGISGCGYGQSHYVRGKTIGAHIVSWFIHHNYWPELHVLHKCDNRKCINPDHLFLGTPQDNQIDCVEKGRNPLAKFKINEIKEIKLKIKNGIRQADIARQYKVSRRYISNIKTGLTWKHVAID